MNTVSSELHKGKHFESKQFIGTKPLTTKFNIRHQFMTKRYQVPCNLVNVAKWFHHRKKKADELLQSNFVLSKVIEEWLVCSCCCMAPFWSKGKAAGDRSGIAFLTWKWEAGMQEQSTQKVHWQSWSLMWCSQAVSLSHFTHQCWEKNPHLEDLQGSTGKKSCSSFTSIWLPSWEVAPQVQTEASKCSAKST